jgi:hypothetical protein
VTAVQLNIAFDMVAAVENALEDIGDLSVDEAEYSVTDYDVKEDGDIIRATVTVEKTSGKFASKDAIETVLAEQLGDIVAEPQYL